MDVGFHFLKVEKGPLIFMMVMIKIKAGSRIQDPALKKEKPILIV